MEARLVGEICQLQPKAVLLSRLAPKIGDWSKLIRGFELIRPLLFGASAFWGRLIH